MSDGCCAAGNRENALMAARQRRGSKCVSGKSGRPPPPIALFLRMFANGEISVRAGLYRLSSSLLPDQRLYCLTTKISIRVTPSPPTRVAATPTIACVMASTGSEVGQRAWRASGQHSFFPRKNFPCCLALLSPAHIYSCDQRRRRRTAAK